VASTNTQFSVAVHIASVLAYYPRSKVVSETLAKSVNADASFVRGVLAKLSKAGLVLTSRGRNGHCRLARPADQISLLELYRATDAPEVFAVHGYPVNKACPISRSHKSGLQEIMSEAQRSFERTLGKKMLSNVVDKIGRR
jgi:Rrf2 family protein